MLGQPRSQAALCKICTSDPCFVQCPKPNNMYLYSICNIHVNYEWVRKLVLWVKMSLAAKTVDLLAPGTQMVECEN